MNFVLNLPVKVKKGNIIMIYMKPRVWVPACQEYFNKACYLKSDDGDLVWYTTVLALLGL